MVIIPMINGKSNLLVVKMPTLTLLEALFLSIASSGLSIVPALKSVIDLIP